MLDTLREKLTGNRKLNREDHVLHNPRLIEKYSKESLTKENADSYIALACKIESIIRANFDMPLSQNSEPISRRELITETGDRETIERDNFLMSRLLSNSSEAIEGRTAFILVGENENEHYESFIALPKWKRVFLGKIYADKKKDFFDDPEALKAVTTLIEEVGHYVYSNYHLERYGTLPDSAMQEFCAVLQKDDVMTALYRDFKGFPSETDNSRYEQGGFNVPLADVDPKLKKGLLQKNVSQFGLDKKLTLTYDPDYLIGHGIGITFLQAVEKNRVDTINDYINTNYPRYGDFSVYQQMSVMSEAVNYGARIKRKNLIEFIQGEDVAQYANLKKTGFLDRLIQDIRRKHDPLVAEKQIQIINEWDRKMREKITNK